VLALGISITLWWFLPNIGPIGDQMKKGGPLVAGLILLLILQPRSSSSALGACARRRAGARCPTSSTACARRSQRRHRHAIALCAKQRGSAANVIRAGLERYQQVRSEGASKEKIVSETQAAIQEANGLEVPLLERNLIALSTIASIATMVGLLGTVMGMIRSFAALGHTGRSTPPSWRSASPRRSSTRPADCSWRSRASWPTTCS